MNKGGKVPEQLPVFAGFLLFFLFTLAGNFSAPHDSIGYLNGIVTGNHLFHPHHLIYHFVSHYWLVFTQPIFPGIKDYYLVETFTALWGSGIMTVAYCFFRNRFKMTAFASIISTSVIAFSYGPWFYSVNIEVYAPPMFFLMMALYVLTKETLQQKDITAIILLHIMAILFHQIHILFTIVILYKFWQQRRTIRFMPAVLQYAAMGAVIVGGAYFIVGWVHEGNNTMTTWLAWLEGYAADNSNYWKPLNSKLPVLVLTGYSHAFIGGHFVFRLPPVEQYLSNSLPNHNLDDEMFLARNISHELAVFLTILCVVLFAGFIWLTIRFVRRFKTIYGAVGHVVMPLIIVGTIYSAFFCFWMPEILEFWIFQTILVWLLLLGAFQYGGKGLPAFKGWGPVRAVVLVAFISILLFVINFFGSVRWLLDLKNDEYYVKIEQVKDVVRPKDMILLQDAWQLKDFLTYFTAAQVHEAPLTDSLRPKVDGMINRCLKEGGKLYIFTEANHYQAEGERYIDSVRNVFKTREKLLPDSASVIYMVE